MRVDTAWNMYVFRDGKVTVPGRDLLQALAAEIRTLGGGDVAARRRRMLSALLRAGELECALADAGSPNLENIESVTDALASCLVPPHPPVEVSDLRDALARVSAPSTVRVAPPEGFAYYALHPLEYVKLLERVPLRGRCAAVIGIRSIGTTLSAVVMAHLKARGVQARRITLRPGGHPYERRVDFGYRQSQWVCAHRATQADFLVVDEGPGMSGSSFLSVGDALLAAGVPRSDIAFLCSREPDPAALKARDAVRRWPSFRSYFVSANSVVPCEAKVYIGGGLWRHWWLGEDRSCWPASWTQMERLKFLSPGGDRLFKFEGFGRFGEDVHQRSHLLGAAGLAPMALGLEEGFEVYPVVSGWLLRREDLDGPLLGAIANYGAFRASCLTTNVVKTPDLEAMLRFNVQEEFGMDLPATLSQLEIGAPVIADARMLPHEWIRADHGSILKLDGASHGDDHFFPGPTDIAWDLAGAIIEWRMEHSAASQLVRHYERLSGDRVRDRLDNYLLAYAVFRMGYCHMAAAAMRGSEEEFRLMHAFHHYRRVGEEMLGGAGLRRNRPAHPPAFESEVSTA